MKIDKLSHLEDRSDCDYANGEYTFFDSSQKRIFKACKGCGKIARASNLNYDHFQRCMPQLNKRKSGFLKVGSLPNRNEVDFRMSLQIMGVKDRSNKARSSLCDESDSESSDSDDSSYSESDIETNQLCKEQVFSQESFGLSSEISKSTITKMSNTPYNGQKEKVKVTKPSQDISSGWKQPTPKDIKSFFPTLFQKSKVNKSSNCIQQTCKKPKLDSLQDRCLSQTSVNSVKSHSMNSSKPSKSSSSYQTVRGSSEIKSHALGFKRPHPSTTFVPKKLITGESYKRQCIDKQSSNSCKTQNRDSRSQSSSVKPDPLQYIRSIYEKSPTNEKNSKDLHSPKKETETQTQSRMIHQTKMIEKFEEVYTQYPRERVLQLERFLEIEKSRYAELKKEYTSLYGKLNEYNNLSGRVADMNDSIQDMVGKVQGDILPATMKVVKLKNHIAHLYKEMGYDENTVQYKTLIESEEYDQLGPVVSQMMKKAQMKQNQKDENDSNDI